MLPVMSANQFQLEKWTGILELGPFEFGCRDGLRPHLGLFYLNPICVRPKFTNIEYDYRHQVKEAIQPAVCEALLVW
jgi:hypothetical protein